LAGGGVYSNLDYSFSCKHPGGTQATLELALPAGKYRAEWINTKTGAVDKKEDFQHNGGTKKLSSPPYREDIALRIAA
jgi:hypothetical protein